LQAHHGGRLEKQENPLVCKVSFKIWSRRLIQFVRL
jgi:hypothetical protein